MAKTHQTSTRSFRFITGCIMGAAVGTVAVLVFHGGAFITLGGLLLIAAYTFYLTRLGPHTASPGNFQAPLLAMLVIGVFSVGGAHYFDRSFAWHPSGTIKKTVQDITKNGHVLDANSEAGEVHADAGDILRYTVTVSNVAAAAANHDNDMANTVMTDTLPDNIRLVDNPTANMIIEDMGTILPGDSVVKTYDVKILSTVKDDAILINKACFTANSMINDNPQSGCDVAYVRADNNQSSTPTPTPTPTSTPPGTQPPSPGTGDGGGSGGGTDGSGNTGGSGGSGNGGSGGTGGSGNSGSSGSTNGTTAGSGTTTYATVQSPKQLPNTGPRDVLVVALFAVLGGYLAHTWYSYAYQGSKKQKLSLK